MAACGPAESESIDAFVVVQETNLTSCALQHSLTQEVQRSCSGTKVTVQVCSDSQICDARFEALTASIAACENATDEFSATTDVGCD